MQADLRHRSSTSNTGLTIDWGDWLEGAYLTNLATWHSFNAATKWTKGSFAWVFGRGRYGIYASPNKT